MRAEHKNKEEQGGDNSQLDYSVAGSNVTIHPLVFNGKLKQATVVPF